MVGFEGDEVITADGEDAAAMSAGLVVDGIGVLSEV